MPQRINFTVRPREKFEVPWSEGYQLYSAILNIIKDNNGEISKYAHDSPISSIAVSMLKGKFKKGMRDHHKTLDPLNQYEFKMGITDPKEANIFRSIIQPILLEERDLKLDRGSLRIEEISNQTEKFEEIIDSIKRYKGTNVSIHFNFRSTTCIQYKNSKVYEMFPHREAVFSSLMAKWNAISPPFKMDIERDEIARYLLERPEPRTYKTHSAMVNTVFDKKKGHHRPILRQGFSGSCTYSFIKGTPRDFMNAILVLSRFAKYSGVGSAVSRGCGWVEVEVNEVR